MYPDVAVFADRKIALSPAGNVIPVAGDLGSPSFRRLHNERALSAISFQLVPLLTLQCPSKQPEDTRETLGNGEVDSPAAAMRKIEIIYSHFGIVCSRVKHR